MFYRKSLAQVITADEIRHWRDLCMVAYEAVVWERLGKDYYSPTDRRVVYIIAVCSAVF